MADKKERLIALFAEIAEHTRPECANTCRVPLSCCSADYCNLAEMYAKEEWNVDLSDKRTDHPTLPFMGPTGCVVPPHLRPDCALHTCQINSLGFKPNDPEWTEKYFNIREQIDILEFTEE